MARIGVVVPELAKHRKAIRRIFSAVMVPDYALPGSGPPALPFNVSLGEPLSSYPLVNAAFLALELAGREIDFERASRLIRSPFLAGADSELACRARLDAWLRKRAEPELTLERLLTLMARADASCPVLAQRLAALAEFRKARLFGGQPPSAWARAISEALVLVGFPGERGLDSTEFQTLAKWHEVLADFAALDSVVLRTGYADAVSRLRRMAADALFQPETPDVPIQVLGELEATGMQFDYLWVMGLSDDTWPRTPRPNPFLPIELQRGAGLPQGSAAGMLELARRLTDEWLSCAGEVVLSYPQREDDREFKPSPLILDVPERPLALPEYASYRDAVHRLRGNRARHGREGAASARYRGARRHVGHPRPGGVPVPRVRAAPTRRQRTGGAARRARRDGARHAGAPRAGAGLGAAEDAGARSTRRRKPTSTRCSRRRRRTPLRASAASGRPCWRAASPRSRSGASRGWRANGSRRRNSAADSRSSPPRTSAASRSAGSRSNARLDRVDRTDDGRRVVIDYKTGKASPGDLLGERPGRAAAAALPGRRRAGRGGGGIRAGEGG